MVKSDSISSPDPWRERPCSNCTVEDCFMPAVNLCDECRRAAEAEPQGDDVHWSVDVPRRDHATETGDYLFSLNLRALPLLALSCTLGLLLGGPELTLWLILVALFCAATSASQREGRRVSTALDRLWRR